MHELHLPPTRYGATIRNRRGFDNIEYQRLLNLCYYQIRTWTLVTEFPGPGSIALLNIFVTNALRNQLLQ